MRAAVRTMALLLLLAAACTSGGERSAGTPRAVTTPRGGTLRVGVSDLGAVLEMDPQTAYNAEPWGLFRCCLLRTLYSYNGAPTEQGGAVPRPDLAAGPPEALAVAKGLLNQAAGMDRLDVHLDRELDQLTRIADGAEFSEGLASFFAKRPARF